MCWRRAGRRPRPSSIEADLNVVGVEFTEGDVANTKSIVTDYIDRFGTIDGVWMDAGATSVGAIEAFEDLGLDVPPITGEDQQDFLRKWKDDGLTAVAPTYPTYQWRTPIIAAVMILQGQEVPKEWTLPQPLITSENLDQYLQPNMPPLHYALCGCENMPDFPAALGRRGELELRSPHPSSATPHPHASPSERGEGSLCSLLPAPTGERVGGEGMRWAGLVEDEG